MANGIYMWLDSGANIHSCNSQFLTWDELGISEEEFDEMSMEDQEDFCREIAWERMDWGFEKADSEPGRY